jgi:hypothetical protein
MNLGLGGLSEMITRAAATGTTIIPRFVNVVAFLSKTRMLFISVSDKGTF